MYIKSVHVCLSSLFLTPALPNRTNQRSPTTKNFSSVLRNPSQHSRQPARLNNKASASPSDCGRAQ
jgi:hypothetical protein